jgi:hypothetical protein
MGYTGSLSKPNRSRITDTTICPAIVKPIVIAAPKRVGRIIEAVP